MKKEKATPQSSPKQLQLDIKPKKAQLKILLEALIAAGSNGVSTLQAIEELDALRPGARIKELRKDGYEIATIRITAKDAHGREHRGIAKYVLIRQK